MKQRVLAFDPKASLGQPTLIGYYSAEFSIARAQEGWAECDLAERDQGAQ